MKEPYNPSPEELLELDELQQLDPDPDPMPEDFPPFKGLAGWSRYCQTKLHLQCRGLSRRSCVCACHIENRAV